MVSQQYQGDMMLVIFCVDIEIQLKLSISLRSDVLMLPQVCLGDSLVDKYQEQHLSRRYGRVGNRVRKTIDIQETFLEYSPWLQPRYHRFQKIDNVALG
jgi:hypothetical protein